MVSRRTSSVYREDVFPRVLYGDSRCSQTCPRRSQTSHRGCQVLTGLLSARPGLSPSLPGASRCTQSSIWCSEVFPNLSQSLPWYSCTSDHRSQLLWWPAGMPSKSLILSWNWRILVYTPHPLRHSCTLPVTKIHVAGEYTALLACRRQCQGRPLSVAPNCYAERSSPQTAGNVNISNYTILNTFTLQARRIWVLAARHNTLNPLSVVNSTLTKIQSRTWMGFPTSNTSNTLQTWSLNHHHHHLCHGRKHTLVLALNWVITLLSILEHNAQSALRRTYKTISTTRLRHVRCTNRSTVESRRRIRKRTMRMCWRKKTPLCVSQASKMGIVSINLWLACQMISIMGSGNDTLSRVWDGMTVTHAPSITGYETSSKARESWTGSQPTQSIWFMLLSGVWTAMRHRNASIPWCTLWTGGGRQR